ncbi:MAG TPA: hypothetical protein VF923_05145 [Gemmatimonadales bacterium]
MFKKLAAGLMLVGLALPYSCGARPVVVAWDDLPSVMLLGIPVIAAVAYALVALLPTVARFQERHGRTLHAAGRALFLALWGAYLYAGLPQPGPGDAKGPISEGLFAWVTALVVTGALLYWQQQRGTKTERLQLLRLTVVGLPVVMYLVSGLIAGGLQIGAWVLTAGWLVGVVAEVQTLQRAPKVAHSG